MEIFPGNTFLFVHLDSCKLFYYILHGQRIPNMCLDLTYDIGKWVKKMELHLGVTDKLTNTDLYNIDGCMNISCTLAIHTVSALLKPRGSILQNGNLGGVLLIFYQPGVVIQTGFN